MKSRLRCGEHLSAGFQLAWMARQARAATLAGQPTGGKLRGLGDGEWAWPTLPDSGAVVGIPLLAHGVAAEAPDASLRPDLVFDRRFAAQRGVRVCDRHFRLVAQPGRTHDNVMNS